jgi:hypothetical protein
MLKRFKSKFPRLSANETGQVQLSNEFSILVTDVLEYK